MSVLRNPLLVVAGVIKQQNRFLIAQRRVGGTFPLKWEFPGGKLEQGESPKGALRRELREELGIEAVIGPELARYECSYPNHRTVVLLFFEVREYEGIPENLAFEQFVWEPREKLKSYDFLDGDLDFVRRLTSGQYMID